jgi:SARP family transcriptional regulator, regulator of embCAB operon
MSRRAAVTGLTDRYPLREGLYRHLVLAQYRSGRTADSLDTYQRIRGAMVRKLGLEPGERLRYLHPSILNDDPALDAPKRLHLAS